VLYLADADARDTIADRLGREPIAPANPYWARHGIAFADPDGFHVILVPHAWDP
jgi:hypothetical protein